MTLFDLIAVVILLVSGLVGFARGAVRELVTVFAFTLAAVAAVYLLPFSGPLFRDLVKPAWASTAAAVVAVFVIAYILLRLAGHWMSARLHARAALGTVDRTIGLGFGVVRALVFLGVFYLIFNLATPPELVPKWISNGKLYPLARVSAQALQSVAPDGLGGADRFGPALGRVVEDGAGDLESATSTLEKLNSRSPGARNLPPNATAYDKRSRDDIDALVERSR